MPEHTLAIVDHHTGKLLVETDTPAGRAAAADLSGQLGPADPLGCARPRAIRRFPVGHTSDATIRVRGYWHDSLIEGPGRRSVLQMQGCPIRCHGCWVPETWSATGGQLVDIRSAADALLDPEHERDGVTILGGEPFAQPRALLALVAELLLRQPDLHICVYTGYSHNALQTFGSVEYAISLVLAEIDLLIDGPYVAAQADTAGPWTGSGNQIVHTLR